MSVLIGKSLRGPGRDRPRPELLLTNDSVAEDAAPGTVVGSLFVHGGAPPYAFLLLGDAGGRFALSGADLVVAGPLDFETASTHLVTVVAVRQGGTGESIVANLVIRVRQAAVGGLDFSLASNSQYLALLRFGFVVATPSLDFSDPDNSQYLALFRFGVEA